MITYKDFFDDILLLEGFSPVLYHGTEVWKLYEILKENKFMLSVAFGTKSDLDINKGRFYYFSLSRIKFGGWMRSNFYEKNSMVNIVLDGRKLQNNHKGTSVDYWGDFYRDSSFKSKDLERFLKNTENEERLITNKSELRNARKYIKEIHIFVPEDNNVDNQYLPKINKICKSKNISVYYHSNPSAFKTLNKKKATQDFSDLGHSNFEDTRYKPLFKKTNTTRHLKYSLEIFNAKSWNELSKEAKTYAYDLRYPDLHASIESDIHTYKTKKEKRREIERFGKAMRNVGAKNVKEFVEYLKQKVKRWWDEDEV